MRSRGWAVWGVGLLVGGLLLACSESTPEAGPFDLSSSPAFVQRIIPGHRPVALVGVGGSGDTPVELTVSSSLETVAVSLEPSSAAVGDVVEIWADVPEVTEEVPWTVTVTGTRAGATASLDISATLVPGTDDLAGTAGEIVGLFLENLRGEVDGLPATVPELGQGTPVAGLLVVSHYAWFTDQFEVGLAWHIMVAPDDFAELYLRPRDTLAPTRAFRITSWSTALAEGGAEVVAVEPPGEVVR